MKVVKALKVHIEIASSYFGTSYFKKAWWHFNPSRLLQAFWTEHLATKYNEAETVALVPLLLKDELVSAKMYHFRY